MAEDSGQEPLKGCDRAAWCTIRTMVFELLKVQPFKKGDSLRAAEEASDYVATKD